MFPAGDLTKAFESFKRLISTDPVIKAANVLIETGYDPLTEMGQRSSVTNRHLVGIKTSGASCAWATEGQHTTPLQVDLLIAIPRGRDAEFLNFWSALMLAVFPQDTERKAEKSRILVDTKIDQITMLSVPAPATTTTGSGLVGTGSFLLHLYLSTKE